MERCGRLMKACGGAALDGWRLAALENAWYQVSFLVLIFGFEGEES